MNKINIKHKNVLDLEIKNYEKRIYESYINLIKTKLAKDLKRQGIDFNIKISMYGPEPCLSVNQNTLFNNLKYFDKLEINSFSSYTLKICYFYFEEIICVANYNSKTITFKNKITDKIFDKLNAAQQKQIINWLINNHKLGYKFGKNAPECFKPYLLFI